MRTILGREPAYWLALASAAIAFISSAIFPLSTEQQGTLNAVVAAVLGVVTAFALKGEGLVAALVGFFKAALAAGMAFKLHLSPELQSAGMLLIELILTGVLVRPNVIAPVPPQTAVIGPDGTYDISTLRAREA
jgi:hypothetical protein